MNRTKTSHAMWFFVSMAALISCAVATNALADFSGAVGVQQSFYTEESSPEWSFGGKLGHTSVPVYAWAGYEAPRLRMLGQPMADSDIFSAGLGVEKGVAHGVSVFLEGGYSFISLDKNENVVDEVSYSQLAQNHAVGGRVPPVCAYNPGCYEYSYDVDDGFVARIGAAWALSEHLSVTGAYKWTYLDQEITIFDPERRYEGDGGYWREDNTADLSAFELGIWYTF